MFPKKIVPPNHEFQEGLEPLFSPSILGAHPYFWKHPDSSQTFQILTAILPLNHAFLLHKEVNILFKKTMARLLTAEQLPRRIGTNQPTNRHQLRLMRGLPLHSDPGTGASMVQVVFCWKPLLV